MRRRPRADDAQCLNRDHGLQTVDGVHWRVGAAHQVGDGRVDQLLLFDQRLAAEGGGSDPDLEMSRAAGQHLGGGSGIACSIAARISAHRSAASSTY